MKRWPAFSLVEMAVVLMITGILLTQVPILMKIYKTHQTKQQIDLAMKSLGAYVAQHQPLPPPDPDLPRSDDEFILKGTLDYKKLGITRTGPAIQYAVNRAFADQKIYENSKGLCDISTSNHFFTDSSRKNDPFAFELSLGKTKIQMTRNNFMAQYCGAVCTLLPNTLYQAPTAAAPNNNITTVIARLFPSSDEPPSLEEF